MTWDFPVESLISAVCNIPTMRFDYVKTNTRFISLLCASNFEIEIFMLDVKCRLNVIHLLNSIRVKCS